MAVKIELSGGKILADIPWMNGEGPKLAKSIPGARPKRDKATKKFIGWTYPANMAVCREFRRIFGADLKVGVRLAEWAREELQREAAQLELRSATDASLSRVAEVAPALAAAMESRTYQRVGARFAVDGRTVLIADEPGLGKTLETLAALVEDGVKTVLVFAKKKAIETVWAAEVPRWLGPAAAVYPVTGSAAQRRLVLERFRADFRTGAESMQIVVGNIEMVRRVKQELCCATCFAIFENIKDPVRKAEVAKYAIKHCENRDKHKHLEEAKYPELFEPEWDAIVVDESHKALIGKNVMSKSISQTRLGMMRLRLHPGGLKIALSGTPFRGKPEHAWGTLNWLNPKLFSSFWNWVAMYFEIADNGFGKSIGKLRPECEEAYDRMLAPYMLRRTKAEVAPDMPPRLYGGTPLDPADPNTTIGVWLEMEPGQAKQYRKIEQDGVLRFGDGQKILLNGLLSELTRRKQFAVCNWKAVTKTIKGEEETVLVPDRVDQSPKYQWLVEFIEERRESGSKVVVASQFTKVVNAFSAALRADGIESYTLTGETSEKAAMANVAAFNDPADPTPVFLINTMAGGESINLDTCADDIVFLDETFIPDDQEQVENRIHRMSRIHQVTVWYLRSRKTVEQDICTITGARELMTKSRLDGSRGVNILRQLVTGQQGQQISLGTKTYRVQRATDSNE